MENPAVPEAHPSQCVRPRGVQNSSENEHLGICVSSCTFGSSRPPSLSPESVYSADHSAREWCNAGDEKANSHLSVVASSIRAWCGNCLRVLWNTHLVMSWFSAIVLSSLNMSVVCTKVPIRGSSYDFLGSIGVSSSFGCICCLDVLTCDCDCASNGHHSSSNINTCIIDREFRHSVHLVPCDLSGA
eukprot:5473103-Amphidinium_carterae.1